MRKPTTSRIEPFHMHHFSKARGVVFVDESCHCDTDTPNVFPHVGCPSATDASDEHIATHQDQLELRTVLLQFQQVFFIQNSATESPQI